MTLPLSFIGPVNEPHHANSTCLEVDLTQRAGGVYCFWYQELARYISLPVAELIYHGLVVSNTTKKYWTEFLINSFFINNFALNYAGIDLEINYIIFNFNIVFCYLESNIYNICYSVYREG